MLDLSASPLVLVHYLREAYVDAEDQPLRITFDRELSFTPSVDWTDSMMFNEKDWHPVPEIPVILEIKFSNTFPWWVNKMIQRFGLHRDSIAKYLICVKDMKRQGIPIEGYSRSLMI